MYLGGRRRSCSPATGPSRTVHHSAECLLHIIGFGYGLRTYRRGQYSGSWRGCGGRRRESARPRLGRRTSISSSLGGVLTAAGRPQGFQYRHFPVIIGCQIAGGSGRRPVREEAMFETTIAGSLPKPGLAGRDQQAVGAVAARGRGACKTLRATPPCSPSRSRRMPASTSSATASRRVSTSCTASWSASRASTSPTRSRWASAPTATRRWCRRWWRRCG